MQRIQRAIALLLLLGTVAPALTACQGGPNVLLSLALGIGVAVGTYYLTKAITD